MTYGSEVRLVPTAMQVVSRGQSMAVSWEPVGIELGSFQLEKLLVLSDVDPPPGATPTATQVVDVAQETDDRRPTVGCGRVVHVLPS